MYKRIQDDSRQEKTVAAAAEVECECICKSESPEPGDDPVEANFTLVQLGVHYDING